MSTPICLFDLDGTLTDPREGIIGCIRHAFRQLRRESPPEPELLKWIGPPLHESFCQALGCEHSAGLAVNAYRERFDRIGWLENRPVPGILEVLQTLALADVPCHVATSKPAVFARRIVEHFGFSHWIGEVYGSQLDGTHADKAELIAHILDETGFHAPDVIMIGDRRHDVEGALARGVRTVGVLWGFGDRTELTTAGADAIAAHPGELAELCLRSSAEDQAGGNNMLRTATV